MLGEHFTRGVSEGKSRNPGGNYQTQQRIRPLQRAQTVGKYAQKPPRFVEPKNKARNHERLILPLCNMERFLMANTPSVSARSISKAQTTMQDLKTSDVEYQSYFLLADLWESFKKWSAYGAAVPLLLNDCEYVVQYYVPYLSAIQIYVDPSKSRAYLRGGSQENGGECIVKDSRSDSESERISTHLSPKMENLSTTDRKTEVWEGLPKNEGGSVNLLESLLFDYVEYDTPYTREPLFAKISELALLFPVLKNLRSCDVLSCSWFSVAWYPIYRIPTGPTMKDLEACFLTYHSLHTPLGGGSGVETPILTYRNGTECVQKIPLPSFGLSTYKYRESMWVAGSSKGRKVVNSLSDAAYDWLTTLKAHHPDFTFFASRR